MLLLLQQIISSEESMTNIFSASTKKTRQRKTLNCKERKKMVDQYQRSMPIATEATSLILSSSSSSSITKYTEVFERWRKNEELGF